jgi:hypothetical protein
MKIQDTVLGFGHVVRHMESKVITNLKEVKIYEV